MASHSLPVGKPRSNHASQLKATKVARWPRVVVQPRLMAARDRFATGIAMPLSGLIVRDPDGKGRGGEFGKGACVSLF